MPSPRVLLSDGNLRAKKQLGQNFLTDQNIAHAIVAQADLKNTQTVLEIGAGLGALTIPISRQVEQVHAVEVDKNLTPLLRDVIENEGIRNVKIWHNNILRLDFSQIIQKANLPIIVIGNLPYNISSQIIVKMIRERRFISKAVFMLQKEMAVRLMASPGGKDYGRLSVVLNYCANQKKLMDVPAHLFFPKPKIDSQVIQISFFNSERFQIEDETFLFHVIKAAFGKRRKTVQNALSQSSLGISKQIITACLLEAGIEPVRRAETLSIEEYVTLSQALFRTQSA